jgi:uncharacterized protein
MTFSSALDIFVSSMVCIGFRIFPEKTRLLNKSDTGRDANLNMKDRDEKVKIAYPCRWVYKVIGLDQDRMRAAITELIPDGDCVITTSRSSVTGRYHCLNIDKPVKNEDDRVSLYEALRKHPAIKIIL